MEDISSEEQNPLFSKLRKLISLIVNLIILIDLGST